MWLVAVVLGLLALATGLLSPADAVDVTTRLAPVLVFLVAVTVLAELADQAELFDVAAVRAARAARGRVGRLYLLVLVLGTATTIVLSLDTTAVLVTPVVLSLASQLELDPLPFAFAAVWLANTASLLLPVSNLTNLLAMDRLHVSPTGFAQRTALLALVAILLTWAALAIWHRRRLRGRYAQPPPRAPRDRRLFVVAFIACLGLIPALLLGVPVAWSATAAALLLAAAFVVRRPAALRWPLVPWRLVLLVEGLFLAVSALGPHGLDTALRTAAGHGTGFLGHLRVSSTAAAGANIANNLPTYLAMERAVPQESVVDVLVGVNLGPLILPWGSLATLLWMERCRARGLPVTLRSFALPGLAVVPVLLLAAAALPR